MMHYHFVRFCVHVSNDFSVAFSIRSPFGRDHMIFCPFSRPCSLTWRDRHGFQEVIQLWITFCRVYTETFPYSGVFSQSVLIKSLDSGTFCGNYCKQMIFHLSEHVFVFIDLLQRKIFDKLDILTYLYLNVNLCCAFWGLLFFWRLSHKANKRTVLLENEW